MSTTVYDFAIVGAGAAGLNLALAMNDDSWFADKKILLLDKEQKRDHDKTWCFWEKGPGKWDSIITQNWTSGKFITSQHNLDLKLSPYSYKMLHADNFYKYAKKKIETADNIDWITNEVKQIQAGEMMLIKTEQSVFSVKQVFDSRIDPDFFQNNDKYIRLLQHFKGWFITAKDHVFDPTTFVMMDYRNKWQDTTSFTYILPTSSTEALVEFTFFSPKLVNDEIYDHQLEKYVSEILKIEEYSIDKVEKGVIPMSNYPFIRANQKGIYKIGTAGGWVKPSSGYSFKNAEKMSSKILNNLKAGHLPDKGLHKKKYRIYDTLFLDVLSRRNEIGEELFTTMYTKNPIHRVFEFLDEDTNFIQDIAIMNTFDWEVFFKAIKNQYL